MFGKFYCLLITGNCVKIIEISTGKFYFFSSINKACFSHVTRPSVHSFHCSPCFPQYGHHELKKKTLEKQRYRTSGASVEIFFIDRGGL